MKKRDDYTLSAQEAAAILEIGYSDLSGRNLSKQKRMVGNRMRVFYSASEIDDYRRMLGKYPTGVRPERQNIHEGELSNALRASGL